MSILLEITTQCLECKKETKMDSDEYFFTCDECQEKQETILGKHLLNHLYDNGESVLDGTHLVGFKSEQEKYIFMRGVRYGYDHAGFKIMYYFGDIYIKLLEELSEKFYGLKIQTNYDEELEKELENERIKDVTQASPHTLE